MNSLSHSLKVRVATKYIFSLALMLTLGLAATQVSAQSLKVGVVDFQRALNEVNEGKQAKARLKSEFEAKQQQLNTKQEALKKLKEQIEAKRAALSADAMRKEMEQFQAKFMDLQNAVAQSRQEMATKEAEMTQGIVVRLKKTVEKIGKEGGYDLVFESSGEALLYAPNATDLTSKVISSFNSGR